MTDLMNEILDLHAIAGLDSPSIPLNAARMSLFDWMVCGRVGTREPVAEKMHAFMTAQAGAGAASVFGSGIAPPRMTALVNGTTSRALDFDHTHFAHVGHLSVGVCPDAMAVGEAEGATVSQVVAAFLLGAEVVIRVGLVLGNGHHNRGFHQTATAGAFGAAIAAGRLMSLTRDQMRMAIGLCSSRVSGLKSQFGTMGKTLNAGIAAAIGIEAVQLARLGMTSYDAGLMDPRGFIPTHSEMQSPFVARPNEWLFSDIRYKFHACCHGTHAMIEALCVLRPLDTAQVEKIVLQTSPRWLSVCNIANPTTGLEVKFRYSWLAAMVLMGHDTGALDSYWDKVATDPKCAKIAKRIKITPDETLIDMQAKDHLLLRNGTQVPFGHDLNQSLSPSNLKCRLVAKSRSLLGAAAVQLRPLLDRSTLSAQELGTHMRAVASAHHKTG